MTTIQQPSNRTEREACALHASTSIKTTRPHLRPGRFRHMTRLAIVAIALMGTLGMAMPAAAQQSPSNSETNALVDMLATTAAAQQFSASPEAVSTGTGEMIVNFAMGYLGSPYVWAGAGPGGFDCSGFTMFVIANTLDIDIGHNTAGQTAYGAWIDWGSWQPGDLVFFANTFKPGISHVGIYIGDGQMIHAENESTGVTISSLYSDYYSGHYAGAYRIG